MKTRETSQSRPWEGNRNRLWGSALRFASLKIVHPADIQIFAWKLRYCRRVIKRNAIFSSKIKFANPWISWTPKFQTLHVFQSVISCPHVLPSEGLGSEEFITECYCDINILPSFSSHGIMYMKWYQYLVTLRRRDYGHVLMSAINVQCTADELWKRGNDNNVFPVHSRGGAETLEYQWLLCKTQPRK